MRNLPILATEASSIVKKIRQHLSKPACVFFSFVLAFSMVPIAPPSAIAEETDLATSSSDLLTGGEDGSGTLSA